MSDYSASAVVPNSAGDLPGESQGYWMKIRKADGASGSYPNRIASVFVVDLYLGLPHHDSRRGRTKGDLTGQIHEPFSRGDNTNHPDV